MWDPSPNLLTPEWTLDNPSRREVRGRARTGNYVTTKAAAKEYD